MILQDIKETKRYRHTFGRSDNVKTVYPPTNTVCGGYNKGADQIRGNRKVSVTAKLICIFVFAYAKSRFSHDAAHIAKLGFQVAYIIFSYFCSKHKLWVPRDIEVQMCEWIRDGQCIKLMPMHW